jgi:hypothetical protein
MCLFAGSSARDVSCSSKSLRVAFASASKQTLLIGVMPKTKCRPFGELSMLEAQDHIPRRTPAIASLS